MQEDLDKMWVEYQSKVGNEEIRRKDILTELVVWTVACGLIGLAGLIAWAI